MRTQQPPTLAVLINILPLARCFRRASAETDCQRREVLVYRMGESKPLCCEVALTFTAPLIFTYAVYHCLRGRAHGDLDSHIRSVPECPRGAHPLQMVLLADHFKHNTFESWCSRGTLGLF